MEYREVKRPAKVGERIRVTNPVPGYEYLSGEEMKIIGRKYGTVMAERENNIPAHLLDDEYVVLEPIEETNEENMEVCEAMATPNYEAENENLRRLCNYQREKHRQLLKAYTNLARYIDICEDGKIRGLEGL